MVKLVAVDVDGTFVRDDYSWDTARFGRIFDRMAAAGCKFVVASGNQYYQLRGVFSSYGDRISYVSDNGAYVVAEGELIFAADIPKATVDFVVDVCRGLPNVVNFMCGVESAYCERGRCSEEFFTHMKLYLPVSRWVEDFKAVADRILKFALLVPPEKNRAYYEILREKLGGALEPVTSGHGSIDLIVPGCHKASGLKRLAERWGINPAECAAFGDSYNDIEMLKFCGESFAMGNASEAVKAVAKNVCGTNNEGGVLIELEKIFGR